MNEKIKKAARALVTCEHPAEVVGQIVVGPKTVHWCAICGAIRLLDGGVLPLWKRSSLATGLTEELVEEALKDPENEAAKQSIAAMKDP